MLKTRNELFFKHVILYLYDLKKSPDESHNYITNLNIYKKECIPTVEKVRLWFTQIKYNSLFNADYNLISEASGEPSTNPEDTQEIPTERQISDETLEVQPPGDSYPPSYYEKVIKKLEEARIDKEKFFEHIIPYRYLVCFALLSRHKKKKKKFLDQIVIGGEEWIHYKYFKAQSSKSAECDSSTIKVKVSIWWNNKGVLFHEILEEPTSDFCLTQLRKLEEALRHQPRVNKKLKVILLHNSFAELETLKSVWLEAEKHEWEILPHPQYSLDIVPSDYHLFGPMNTALQNETKLQNVKELETWIRKWIDSKDKEFWEQGIYSLEKRWENVVEEDGWYFE